jgi:hypothetical protein
MHNDPETPSPPGGIVRRQSSLVPTEPDIEDSEGEYDIFDDDKYTILNPQSTNSEADSEGLGESFDAIQTVPQDATDGLSAQLDDSAPSVLSTDVELPTIMAVIEGVPPHGRCY